MKQTNCNIIKDLLPGYSDKILSNESNRLVEEHLQECESCNKILKDMNEDINIEQLFNKCEQIDYLKGYKKNKKRIVIFSILWTIIILITMFIIIYIYCAKDEFFVNIEDIYIDCCSQSESDGKASFIFNMCDINNKRDYKCYKYEKVEDTGIKTIHIRAVGKYPFGEATGGWCFVEIDDTIEKIYLEDKKGNSIEIWDKSIGLQMKDLTKAIKY